MSAAIRHRRSTHPRYARTLALTALCFAVAAGPAPAQEPLPGDNAGTGQYVEPVPSAGGDRPAASGPGRPGGRLAPSVRRRLPPTGEGRLLERIATDPGAGAPTAQGPSGGAARQAQPRAAGEDEPSAFAAVGEAIAGRDGLSVPLLLVAIVALTLGAAAAGRRARARG